MTHAGGGIENKRYTNTIEAKDLNYRIGFRLFELDLSWTSNNHLVCLHDWKSTAKRLFNHQTEKPVSLAVFHQLAADHYHWTPCNLSSIGQWLEQHPDAYVITDIKGRCWLGQGN